MGLMVATIRRMMSAIRNRSVQAPTRNNSSTSTSEADQTPTNNTDTGQQAPNALISGNDAQAANKGAEVLFQEAPEETATEKGSSLETRTPQDPVGTCDTQGRSHHPLGHREQLCHPNRHQNEATGRVPLDVWKNHQK